MYSKESAKSQESFSVFNKNQFWIKGIEYLISKSSGLESIYFYFHMRKSLKL